METIFPSRFSRTEDWRHAHTRQSTVIRPWKYQRCHEPSRFHRPDIPGCQLVCFPLPSRLPGAEAVNATLPGWAGTQQHKSWCACTHSQSHQVDGQGGDPATPQQAERRGVPDCLQHGVHGENVILHSHPTLLWFTVISRVCTDTLKWPELKTHKVLFQNLGSYLSRKHFNAIISVRQTLILFQKVGNYIMLTSKCLILAKETLRRKPQNVTSCTFLPTMADIFLIFIH